MIENYPKISGKVRDIYDIGNNYLVMVTTDRLSAFDIVLPSIIPHRARILTELTLFWAKELDTFHSIVSGNLLDMPVEFQKPEFEYRTLLVHKCKMIPYECVVRGFLAGSGWSEYKEKGTVAEVKLPYGLQQNCPISSMFTPARKNKVGHDENISFDIMSKEYDEAYYLRKISIELFNKAQNICFSKGLYLADTKFEFGKVKPDDYVLLCDEILTPDNSRLYPVETYKIGPNVPSVDKQIVRNYLSNCGWNKIDPPPVLPDHIIEEVSQAYQHVLYLLTGKTL